MKSKTKHALSDEQIKKLVHKQFGKNQAIDSIEELKGGMFNSAYLIKLAGGDQDVVLKVSVPPDAPVLSYEVNLMRTEVSVYQRLAQETSIPLPDMLGYDFSRELIPSDYFFMSALKGQTMKKIQKKLTNDQLARLKQELGDYFAQIHQIKGAYFGYFTDEPKKQFASWKQAFQHMLQMILQDGRRLNVKLPYERIEAALNQWGHLLDAVKVPSLVDYDLWPGNIFLRQEGNDYRVEAIVDFERAFWGDPYADFPASITLFKDIREEREFWQAYTSRRGDVTTITNEDYKRILLYKLYIFLIMAVETYRYGWLYGKLQLMYSKKVIAECLKELENEK